MEKAMTRAWSDTASLREKDQLDSSSRDFRLQPAPSQAAAAEVWAVRLSRAIWRTQRTGESAQAADCRRRRSVAFVSGRVFRFQRPAFSRASGWKAFDRRQLYVDQVPAASLWTGRQSRRAINIGGGGSDDRCRACCCTLTAASINGSLMSGGLIW